MKKIELVLMSFLFMFCSLSVFADDEIFCTYKSGGWHNGIPGEQIINEHARQLKRKGKKVKISAPALHDIFICATISIDDTELPPEVTSETPPTAAPPLAAGKN